MSGTKLGGLRAKEANLDRYGKDYYAVIGTKGGKVSGVKKGFALRRWCDKQPCPFDAEFGDHYVVQCAGARGGTKSRR